MARRTIVLIGIALASGSWLASTASAAPKATSPSQGLSAAVIQKTVRTKAAEFRQCYEDLDDQPPMRVDMHFTIAPDGKVTTGYVEADVRPAIAPCITRTMFSLTFPRPSGGDVAVVYSMNFDP